MRDSIYRITQEILGIDAPNDALRVSFRPKEGGNYRLIINAEQIRIYDVEASKYIGFLLFNKL